MNNKLILLAIVIFAVGIIVLPETISLFAGQHSWYEVNQSTTTGDYGIPCVKCHEDIQQQMNSPENHVHNSEMLKLHITYFLFPHEAFPGYVCTDCHGVGNSKHLNATSILYGANESHIKFATDASNATLLKGSNEACTACHSRVAVNLVWEKPTTMNFNINRTDNVWDVGNFTATGSKTTTSTG